MSDQQNQSQNQNSNPDDRSSQGANAGYSREYVKELRDEAAGYRTRLRDAETKIGSLEESITANVTKSTIASVLEKKSVKVNPDWITIGEGQNPEQAVDTFLKEYPQFAGESTQSSTQKPMSTEKKNTNVPSNISPDYSAEKGDPIARAKSRENYRSLLRSK